MDYTILPIHSGDNQLLEKIIELENKGQVGTKIHQELCLVYGEIGLRPAPYYNNE